MQNILSYAARYSNRSVCMMFLLPVNVIGLYLFPTTGQLKKDSNIFQFCNQQRAAIATYILRLQCFFCLIF